MINSLNDTNHQSDSDQCKAYIFDSAEMFLKYLSPNGPVFGEFDLLGKDHWVFRGHKDSNFELKPSAFRKGVKLLQQNGNGKVVWRELRREDSKKTVNVSFEELNKKEEYVTFEEQIKAEYYTIKEFFRLADEQGLPMPEDSQRLRAILHSFDDLKKILEEEADKEQKISKASEKVPPVFKWPPKELRSLIALAQHYGIPTRLLDWTFSPLTAAWFAAKGVVEDKYSNKNTETEEKYLDVWALNKSELLKEKSTENSREKQEFLLKIITAPAAGNPHLHAQKGLFTMIRRNRRKTINSGIEGNNGKDLWELREDVDEITVDKIISTNPEKLGCESKNTNAILLRFLLPHEQAERLLTMLARQGVTKAELFPGYDGVAKMLSEDRTYQEDAQDYVPTDPEKDKSEIPKPFNCSEVKIRLRERVKK